MVTRKAALALVVAVALAAPIVLSMLSEPLQAHSHKRAADIQTEETALKDALFQLRNAIDRYYAAKKQYPSRLAQLVSEGYLKQIPTDPFTRRSDSWKTVPDPNKPADESAIFDIRSGSQARAVDGTKYSAW